MMNKNEALEYMRKNIGVRLKLNWWSDYMFMLFDGKKFISGGGETIDLRFLLDGDYEEAKTDDRLLGGLFAL